MRSGGIQHLFSRRLIVNAALCALTFFLSGHIAYANTRVGHVDLSQLQSKGVTTQSTNTALTVPVGQDTITYTFPAYTTPFIVNAIGLTFTGSIPEGTLEASVTTTQRSGEILVRELDMLGDDRKYTDNSTHATNPVIVDSVRSFTLTLTLHTTTSGTPHISDLQVIYLNSLDSAAQGFSAATTQTDYTTTTTPLFSTLPTSALQIISREEWGADEEYRYTITESIDEPATVAETSIEHSDTETIPEKTLIWPAEYSTPEVFIVHHTAGSDGGDDPAATIRAIYYFHAVVYGWGDIGYNYIIDPQGNIYEGRAGGDGVVGGHAYNSSTNIGYNVGSIGISLLGCYEAGTNACATKNTMTPEMLSALDALITEKAQLFTLDVSEEITFHDTPVHRLIGHREVAHTLCPGDSNMDYLTALRASISIKTRVAAERDSEIISAELTNSDNTPVALSALKKNTDYTLTLRVRNTGVRRWLRKNTYLIVSNGVSDTTPTQFISDLWPATDGRIKWNKGTKKVFSNQEILFTIPIHTPRKKIPALDVHIHIYTTAKNLIGPQDVGGIQRVELED